MYSIVKEMISISWFTIT